MLDNQSSQISEVPLYMNLFAMRYILHSRARVIAPTKLILYRYLEMISHARDVYKPNMTCKNLLETNVGKIRLPVPYVSIEVLAAPLLVLKCSRETYR